MTDRNPLVHSSTVCWYTLNDVNTGNSAGPHLLKIASFDRGVLDLSEIHVTTEVGQFSLEKRGR